MQETCEHVTIVAATISETFHQVGLKAGETFYLAWDEVARRLFVVQWERMHWACTCRRKACIHQFAANQYVFEQTMKKKSS